MVRPPLLGSALAVLHVKGRLESDLDRISLGSLNATVVLKSSCDCFCPNAQVLLPV